MCTITSTTTTFILLLALTMAAPWVEACGVQLPRPASETMYDDDSAATHIFRGTVIRDISPLHESTSALSPPGTASLNEPLTVSPTVRYVVQVNRMYKGCSLKAMDRILVTSGGVCGTSFQLDTTYLFTTDRLQPMDAAHRAMLGNRSKVKQVLYTSSETVTQEWNQVNDDDKAVYNASRRKCL